MSLRVYQIPLTLLTHKPPIATTLAPVFERGNKAPLYPYTRHNAPKDPPVPVTYRMWALENDYIRAIVAPQMGGHLWSLRDKRIPTPKGDPGPGAELLYANPSVKHSTVEPRNHYISSGIEFNFPVAHSHTSSDPVASRAYLHNGRAAVEVGETERRLGTSWVIRLSLGEKDTFLTQESFLHNPSPRAAQWHLWSNAAVPGYPDTEFIYPPAKIMIHGSVNEFARWPLKWSKIAQQREQLGLFWIDQRDLYFGAYMHRRKYGLMHLADPKVVPGMKLWTWGAEGSKRWAKILTDENMPICEVQSGGFKTQEDYGLMQPGESAYFIEFWTGAQKVADYARADLPRPKIDLPPPVWFGDDHIPEVRRWRAVMAAHRRNAPSEIPAYNPADLDWPPPGIELEAALRWAARHRPTYRTALGTWLAGREDFDAAAAALQQSADPYGQRLEGLMAWKVKKDAARAVALYKKIQFDNRSYLFEFDALLAQTDRHKDRQKVLRKLGAFQRGWIGDLTAEHLAHYLVATGQYRKALAVMENRHWANWHERFLRTDIWRRARAGLGLAQDPVPEMLGEDKVRPMAEGPTPVGPLDGLLRK